MNLEDIKNDIAGVTTRVKTGRVVAHVLIHNEEFGAMTNFDIAEAMGLSPSSAPDISRARAAVKQLSEMGYKIVGYPS